MNAICSHSVRWARNDPAVKEQLDELYDGGALFGKHARGMVFEELSSGSCSIPTTCSVPTVQTLLLLSAQECSVGNSAQAWIYSGIAFRIIDHLGICVDGERYPGSVQLADEEVEIRHRLFWSCFFWDKILSLYLGRSPSLRHSSVSPPRLIREFFDLPNVVYLLTQSKWTTHLRTNPGCHLASLSRTDGSTHHHQHTPFHASCKHVNSHSFSTKS